MANVKAMEPIGSHSRSEADPNITPTHKRIQGVIAERWRGFVNQKGMFARLSGPPCTQVARRPMRWWGTVSGGGSEPVPSALAGGELMVAANECNERQAAGRPELLR